MNLNTDSIAIVAGILSVIIGFGTCCVSLVVALFLIPKAKKIDDIVNKISKLETNYSKLSEQIPTDDIIQHNNVLKELRLSIDQVENSIHVLETSILSKIMDISEKNGEHRLELSRIIVSSKNLKEKITPIWNEYISDPNFKSVIHDIIKGYEK